MVETLQPFQPRQEGIFQRHTSPYEILIERGALKERDLKDAQHKARTTKTDLPAILEDKFQVGKGALEQAFTDYYRCPVVPFNKNFKIPEDLLTALNPTYLKRHGWVPLKVTDRTVAVLTDDPENEYKNNDIRKLFPGKSIVLYLGFRSDIHRFIEATTHEAAVADAESKAKNISQLLEDLAGEALGDVPSEDFDDVMASDDDSAIIQLVNRIIADAQKIGASDIHIEPNSAERDTAVRFRVDGECRLYQRVPASYRRAIASRLKIMAGLDIAERRLPQDGKIVLRPGGKKLELRVATIPTSGPGNEDIVLRLLASGEAMQLDELNLLPRNFKLFKEAIERPYGMVLVVGPTGSGKTTTLHSGLRHLNTPSTKIWTAEDPVEITQPGLRQVQMQPKIGLNFASALRAFLRADPDVVMIGEMRDPETIEIALKAALTGHLVMSTLHTNSAPETITRLLDMGVDPFTYSDALLGVLAQRLIRTLCAVCKAPVEASDAKVAEIREIYGTKEFDKLKIDPVSINLHEARGCDICSHTGYKGRTGVHEYLHVTEDLRKDIQNRAKVSEIQKQAIKDGMTTLQQDGLQKVLRGLTDVKQVLATVNG